MFNPNDVESGKSMVVGDCNGLKTEDRWKVETPIFKTIIDNLMGNAKTVLDYGCGVGRVARALLDSKKDIVELVGVDNSPDMLKVAEKYVLSDRFKPMSPENLQDRKFDFTYCIYVLQHVPALQLRDVIRQLARSSKKVFVVNSNVRMAVRGEGFHNDGVDVIEELYREFNSINWAIPFRFVMGDKVMRTMFFEGDIIHYGVLCKNEK